MTVEIFLLPAAALAGFALGLAYFGGLWCTVRRAVGHRRGGVLLLASLVARLALLGGGLALLAAAAGPLALLPAALGFLAARLAWVARVRRLSSAGGDGGA